MTKDLSNGYDAIAEEFASARSSVIGLSVLRNWMMTLPRGGDVLDVGAGLGEPLTADLIEEGFNVFAIDASPKMVAQFQRRFPDTEIACEAAEHSRFFNRKFDGVLAIGLVFLLPSSSQGELITRMAAAVKTGGRLLFSSPRQNCVWEDALTGQSSVSLGAKEYRRIIAAAGLDIIGERVDEGQAYYYDARKI